jgi:hypothetical protein
MTTDSVPAVEETSRQRWGLEFEDFGVALHFVAPHRHVAYATDEINPFTSFEEDLFSYRYGPGRRRLEPDTIFKTEPLEVATSLQTIVLSMPAAIAYESEGAEKTLGLPAPHVGTERRRTLAVKASRTHFPRSNYDVFHLVFVSAGRAGRISAQSEFAIDEYDVVALSKLWQGGEGSRLAEQIRVRPVGGGDAMTIETFALAVFDGELKEADRRVRLGTIQLITRDATCGVAWEEIWDDIDGLCDDERPDTLRHKKQVAGLGGMLQGILDFEEIDTWELADVFAGSKIDSGLVGIHKGTLLCVMESDRSYDVTATRIGVSPYLLLPQAMLLHNEELLDVAARFVSAAQAENDPRKLEDCVNDMGNSLKEFLPNVFHYPQERWLFLQGERSRGLAVRRRQLSEERENLDRLWKQKVATRARFAEDFRNALLVWLAFLPVYPFIQGHVWLEAVAFSGFLLVAVATVALPRRSRLKQAFWKAARPGRNDQPGQ